MAVCPDQLRNSRHLQDRNDRGIQAAGSKDDNIRLLQCLPHLVRQDRRVLEIRAIAGEHRAGEEQIEIELKER